MIEQTPWIERKFEFHFPIGMFPVIIERLRGAVPRLRVMTLGLTEQQLSNKKNGGWSIKEQAGHLADLEPLWYGRIEDFLAHKETLRAADITNAGTTAANHNAKTMEQLIQDFSAQRAKLIRFVENMNEETAAIVSLHPRLKTPMRLVDALYFVAEHDDHHLTKIRSLING